VVAEKTANNFRGLLFLPHLVFMIKSYDAANECMLFVQVY